VATANTISLPHYSKEIQMDFLLHYNGTEILDATSITNNNVALIGG